MFDRRLMENWDWVLLLLLFLIACFSVVNLYSATYQVHEVGGSQVFIKQIYWYLIGFFFFVVMTTFNYSILQQLAYPLYFIAVALLILVLFKGKVVSGSQRWLTIGPVSFQVAEFAKIAVVLVVAKYFSEEDRFQVYSIRELLHPLVLIAIPAVLILKEPDLGTTLHLVFSAMTMVLFIKLSWKSVAILAVPALAIIPFAWFHLKPYQQNRLLTFVRPDMDPLGAGYHINQSKIAIGSGQFLGKGFLKGTQTRLHFLPEQHTDFAYSVLAEEWGFVGSALLLLIYLVLILWCLNIARVAKNKFGSLLAVGIVAIVFWEVAINVAMVTGLLPVVGIPLVFFSYGGSSLVTTMAAMGLLMNINMRRFMFSEGPVLATK
jgi:rod shape determining protein RodA